MAPPSPHQDVSYAEFGTDIVIRLAVPVLSLGYSHLVQHLKASHELARMAKEHGIDSALSGDSTSISSLRKGNRELVTSAEKAAESLMTAAVRKQFPDHAIIGEELGFTPGGKTRGVFDPVDGTSAMIKTAMAEAFGMTLASPPPSFGITRAVVDDSQPVLGIVAELRAENGGLSAANIWIGGKGIPTHCNRRPVKPPEVPATLRETTVACTVPQVMFGTPEKWSGWQALTEATAAVVTAQNCVGYMRLLENNSVIHIVYEADLAYHDAAALVPILEGAGVTVTDGQGRPPRFPESTRKQEFTLLAAAAALHKQALSTILKGIPPEKNTFSTRAAADNGYATKFPARGEKP